MTLLLQGTNNVTVSFVQIVSTGEDDPVLSVRDVGEGATDSVFETTYALKNDVLCVSGMMQVKTQYLDVTNCVGVNIFWVLVSQLEYREIA